MKIGYVQTSLNSAINKRIQRNHFFARRRESRPGCSAGIVCNRLYDGFEKWSRRACREWSGWNFILPEKPFRADGRDRGRGSLKRIKASTSIRPWWYGRTRWSDLQEDPFVQQREGLVLLWKPVVRSIFRQWFQVRNDDLFWLDLSGSMPFTRIERGAGDRPPL